LKVNGLIACDYPDTPIVLFGHSMGSFLARTFLIDYSNLIDGLILTGTGGDPGLMGKIGTLIAKLEKSMKGPKAPSHLLSKLTFGNFNKKIKSTRTKYDWLSTDEESVNKYINDSLCGQVCTTSFYFEMFQGMGALFEKEKKGYIPTHIPILILSGKHDPLGKNGKVLIELYNHYKRANIENVSYRIYQSARHEILNEKNKLEVFSNISSWLEINIQTFSKI
jgi:alpha-beta hydrolase superfamily lysophospholipase